MNILRPIFPVAVFYAANAAYGNRVWTSSAPPPAALLVEARTASPMIFWIPKLRGRRSKMPAPLQIPSSVLDQPLGSRPPVAAIRDVLKRRLSGNNKNGRPRHHSCASFEKNRSTRDEELIAIDRASYARDCDRSCVASANKNNGAKNAKVFPGDPLRSRCWLLSCTDSIIRHVNTPT